MKISGFPIPLASGITPTIAIAQNTQIDHWDRPIAIAETIQS